MDQSEIIERLQARIKELEEQLVTAEVSVNRYMRYAQSLEDEVMRRDYDYGDE